MAESNERYLGTEEQPLTIPTNEERNIAVLSHLLCFIAPLLAPLIIYLLKKDESTFVAAHAKESLNFQITMTLIAIVLLLTLIGFFLLWLVGLVSMILVIVATIKANDKKLYRYPFSLRVIK
jgi:uncharacterized protein